MASNRRIVAQKTVRQGTLAQGELHEVDVRHRVPDDCAEEIHRYTGATFAGLNRLDRSVADVALIAADVDVVVVPVGQAALNSEDVARRGDRDLIAAKKVRRTNRVGVQVESCPENDAVDVTCAIREGQGP